MRRNEKLLIVAGIGISILIGLFLWNNKNDDFFITGQASKEDYITGTPAFYRRETVEALERGEIFRLPNENSDMGFDLRSYNIEKLSLEGYENALEKVSFNNGTVWPEILPENFNPEEIMELGINPGLKIRYLHEMGITGKGVNIAIIDRALNLEHSEYSHNLMGYELHHSIDETAVMHSSAVTSIAVGKTCGVAPGANVYYIASTFADYQLGKMTVNLEYMAESIERIMEINNLLPVDKKIRVISISMGVDKFAKGYRKTIKAIEEAKEEGIFVITTSTEINYGFSLMGLGREAKLNPDDMESYGPGMFWKEGFYKGYVKLDTDKVLLVPMDSRTYADWTSTNDYEYCSVGGVSWSVPWLAGLYALCLEKQPDLTPDIFIKKAFETGTEKEMIQEGESYTLGTIINPVELMNSL